YTNFGTTGVVFASGERYSSRFDLNQVRVGLSRKLDWGDDPKNDALASAAPSQAPVNWEVHGQMTYIQQGYPAFHALYTGPNSLTPWAQTAETLTVSAFLGFKLWDGGELYYNPELLQGFGLGSTIGAGGFPNGEAQKSNFAFAHYSTSRLFLRQTWGL